MLMENYCDKAEAYQKDNLCKFGKLFKVKSNLAPTISDFIQILFCGVKYINV